jgi:hypothetical protein
METRTRTARAVGLLLAAGLAIVACGDDATGVGSTDGTGETTTMVAPPDTILGGDLVTAQAALDEARARWEAAGIEDYTFTYRPVCFCPPQQFTVVVVDGAVASVEAGPDDEDGVVTGEPVTVEAVFDALQAAIDDGVFAVTAEYDTGLGYPVSTWVDVDERMADEEYGVQIEALTPAG